MDNKRFLEYLKAGQNDERVAYSHDSMEPFKDVINELYNDIDKLKYHTFDGRFQDILVKLLKDTKYEVCGYGAFLNDIEDALRELVVDNLILIPINFLNSEKIKNDISFDEDVKLFLPVKEDLEKIDKNKLRIIQEKKRNGKLKSNGELARYFESVIKFPLDKEHIKLAKDWHIFNYPILSIHIQNIDLYVENESSKIAEAIYAFLRMIDFNLYYSYWVTNHGLQDGQWRYPASTYVVYYRDYLNKNETNCSYYGSSLRFGFSNILDIDTDCFVKNKELFGKLVSTYLKACFLDLKLFNNAELNKINRWKNAISFYNTVYELASIEKYDSCSLIICATLESLFLNNEGRNKQERLLEEVKEFISDFCDEEKIANYLKALKNLYKMRNKIIHEGIGYEFMYKAQCGLYDRQGSTLGYKPFKYAGSFHWCEEIYDIKYCIKLIGEILLSEKMLNNISSIVMK